jgi:hypothetical protein
VSERRSAEHVGGALTVGAANDVEEREADVLAANVQRVLDGGSRTAVADRPTRISRGPSRHVIRRTVADGQPNELPPHLGAKSFKKATSVKASKRGESLKTIDKWLAQAENAPSYGLQQYALKQVMDACAHWLEKHGRSADRGKRSVKSRRTGVKKMQISASIAYSGPGVADGGARRGKATSAEDTDEVAFDLVEGLVDAVADGAGITGDYADINLDVTSANDFVASQHGAMSEGGSGALNSAPFDVLEGVNTVGGIMGMAKGFKDLRNTDNDAWEDAEAAGSTVASTGKMIHGAYKLTKGIAIDQGGDSTQWTQFGDVGASFADGTGAVADFITWMKTIRDARKKSREQGGLTGKEKFDAVADTTETGLNVIHKGTKTALDITKAATEVGATDAIVGLSTAAGAVAIVISTIETARGLLQVKRGFDASKTIKKTEARQAAIVADVQSQVSVARDATTKFLVDNSGFAPGFDQAYESLIEDWGKLKTAYEGVVEIQKQSASAMKAMKQLQNRQMEEGAVKAAKGVVGIVSGALLLSGVGAPIAVGVGAIAGIIALSHAGVKLARNFAATGLIELARRLTDDGVPKGKPEAAPAYRDMEIRVEAAYYNNMVSVIKGKVPFGFEKGEFAAVEQFVWDDKKNRLKSLDKTVVRGFAKVSDVSESAMRSTWIQVQVGTKVHNEKPKGKAKVGRAAKPSAHKSSQAMAANKDDIAVALLNLARGSFDSTTGQFKEVPINPVGDTDIIENMQLVTIHGLLGAADITSKRWAAWLAKADDEAAMKKLIIRHLK